VCASVIVPEYVYPFGHCPNAMEAHASIANSTIRIIRGTCIWTSCERFFK
jgi:hypothetical protein